MQCPRCQSTRIVKNGRIHSGKPRSMCKDYRHQFVQNPQQRRIPAQTTALIDKKQANHDGAIWYYIHHHNATIAARRSLITTYT